MRTTVLLLPGILSLEDRESILRGRYTYLTRFAEQGQVVRLMPPMREATPEAALLGVPPDVVRIADGPLTVASLKADPPERSVHFHLSLGSVDSDGRLCSPQHWSELDVRAVMEAASVLNTPRFTIVAGTGLDHGWVWEMGSPEMHCDEFANALGAEWSTKLPEGEGEVAIRRFIDDSVNLLSDLELNRIRVEEGHPPLNILWPWGPGFRARVPQLAVRRGQLVTYRSDSLRLSGLVRLAGYRAGPPLDGKKLDPDFTRWARPKVGHEVTLVPGLGEAMAEHRPDHAAWMLQRLDSEGLKVFDQLREQATDRLMLVATSGQDLRDLGAGLALYFDPRQRLSSTIPWDERALDERRCPEMHLWEAFDAALSDTWPLPSA